VGRAGCALQFERALHGLATRIGQAMGSRCPCAANIDKSFELRPGARSKIMLFG